MSAPIVIDQAIADLLGPLTERCVVLARTRSWWPGRDRAYARRPLDPERLLDVLGSLAVPGWVLVRPARQDCAAQRIAATATLLGHRVITLPGALDEAAWSVGIALRISGSSDDTFGRVLDVVCCGPGAAPHAPSQPWGPTGLAVPALRPTTLARWAYCAWQPCSWCDAGGLPGYACRRCGVPIGSVADGVAA